MAQQISTNTFGVAKWIVSANTALGTHTTITAATAAASSGDTILLRDLAFTEDVAMKAGVNYTALPGSFRKSYLSCIRQMDIFKCRSVSLSNINLITTIQIIFYLLQDQQQV